MNKLWSDRAWDDYLCWQIQDKKTLKRINELVKSIEREGIKNIYTFFLKGISATCK